jgi:uncharacterized membrane protein required for colicin V production
MNLPIPADIPTWVIGCVAFWLLGCIWMGWRRGVVRQVVAILALAGACVAAFTLGPLLAPMVPPLGFPVFVRPIVAGILIGGAVWLTGIFLGAIVFKRTDEQSFGIIRLIYGVLGAGLGLVFGLSVLALAAWGIRLSGSFAEGVQRSSLTKTRHGSKPEPSAILSLKHLLDETSVSSLLARLDPLPSTLYPKLEKAGQLLSSTESFERLLSAPDLEVLTRHPKVIALRGDPELQAAVREGDLLGILRNPKVRAAANDTQIMTALSRINLDQQVDAALSPREKEKSRPSR